MKMAWKEIRYNWKKFILIEILLILLIFMVLFLSGLANGLGRAVSAGIEIMDADYFIMSEDADGLITVSAISNEDLTLIQDENTNPMVALNLSRSYIESSGEIERTDITYFAMEPDSFLAPEIVEGSQISAEGDIVLDTSFREIGIEVGDTILDSATDKEFTVSGFSEDAMYGHIGAGYISLKDYNQLQKEKNPAYTEMIQTLVAQGDSTDAVLPEGYSAVPKSDVILNIPGYQAEQTTIQMILWVLVFVSGAVLGVFFYILTLQKRKQFGVLKAIGFHLREILQIQFSQVILLSAFGAVAGYLLSAFLSGFLPDSMPFYMRQSEAFQVLLAFVGISVFCSLFSIIQIAKVDPVKMIGGNEE
ncbi:MAG: ABC transporter permease [Lachnospiraceae bacterium]